MEINPMSDPSKAQEDLQRTLDLLAQREREEAQQARLAALEEDMRRHPMDYPDSPAYKSALDAVRRLCDDDA